MKKNGFTKQELERLNCTDDEIRLVLDYQSKLPVLLENNEAVEFCIDIKMLYFQLIQSDDLTNFQRWFARLQKSYKFQENIDFKPILPTGRIKNTRRGGDTKSRNYLCTIDMAKQIAMIDKKEIGFIARRYFILMEKIILSNKQWWEIRDPEKIEYNKMSAEVNAWCLRVWNHNASKAEFAVEADMINMIITNKTSSELKCLLHISSNELLRDYLKTNHNEEILFLEIQNQLLLQMDMGFTERKNMLTQMYHAKFKK